MPWYVSRFNYYSARINGHLSLDLEAGEVFELGPADVPAILRDCPALFDPRRPLPVTEARERLAARQAEIAAAEVRSARRPLAVDQSTARYRATRAYGAQYSEYVPVGAYGAAHGDQHIDLQEGQRYELRRVVADWVNRDSPGTLVPDGEG